MADLITPSEFAHDVAFGTSGLRAEVVALNERVVKAWTSSFLSYLTKLQKQRKPQGLIIAWDLRPSSPDIVAAACMAACNLGIEPVLAGEVPTPALALACMQEGMPGLMITGSHIPFHMNGIKFYTAMGEISKQDEAAISHWSIDPALGLPSSPEALAQWKTQIWAIKDSPSSVLQRYRDRYLRCFPKNALAGLRVGLYQHSSVARDFLADFLPQLGAEVVLLGRSDHFVPIDTEAVSSEDQLQFAAWCQDYDLDALVSTDGDADRPLLCDGQGHFIPGDLLGMITARFLGTDTVVVPVSCTTALELSGWFRRVLRTRIGSPYVIEGMQAEIFANRVVAGFEANGGFLLQSDVMLGGQMMVALPTRDSVLPILCALAVASNHTGGLAGYRSDLPKRFTRADRIKSVPVTISRDFLKRFLTDDAVASQWQHTFVAGLGDIVDKDYTDGVRLTLHQGRIIHFRASGNAPELRCYVEAEAPAEAESLLATCMERLRAYVAAI